MNKMLGCFLVSTTVFELSESLLQAEIDKLNNAIESVLRDYYETLEST
jgi:hypothetical protein